MKINFETENETICVNICQQATSLGDCQIIVMGEKLNKNLKWKHRLIDSNTAKYRELLGHDLNQWTKTASWNDNNNNKIVKINLKFSSNSSLLV